MNVTASAFVVLKTPRAVHSSLYKLRAKGAINRSIPRSTKKKTLHEVLKEQKFPHSKSTALEGREE